MRGCLWMQGPLSTCREEGWAGLRNVPRQGFTPRQEGSPQTGCVLGALGKYRWGFPCGRGVTLGDSGGEEEEEGEIPCLLGPALPRGNSVVGDSFPVCSLISIAGAGPREGENSRLSPDSIFAESHSNGTPGQRGMAP